MKYLWLLITALFPVMLFAEPDMQAEKGKMKIHPGIYLKSIKAVNPTEHYGDELYLSVTVYPKKSDLHHYEIPENPLFWKTDMVEKIKDLKVWDRPLHDGEGVTFVLSLVDRDASPWNTDDLLGVAKLYLKNEKGKLIGAWVMPENNDFIPESLKVGAPVDFNFMDKHGNYELTFEVKMEK